ncbi:MAG: DUF928 domain-containing protein [Thainema sp.]
MFLNRSRIGTATLSIAVLASLITGYPSVAKAQTYQPSSSIGLPGRREGGGTRGSCVSSAHQLTAIAPEQNFGYTTDLFPTLHWYVPELSQQTAEFVLYTEDGSEVYASIFVIDGPEGIVSLSLPEYTNLPSLELGQKYRWQFSVICQDGEDSVPSVTFTEGWIERTEIDADLKAQLEQASDLEKATLLAENGIWFDAVDTLAKLRRAGTSPIVSATSVEQAWQTLLSSVGLAEIADVSMLLCCDDVNAAQEDADTAEPNAVDSSSSQ